MLIKFALTLLLIQISTAILASDNLSTCLSGKYATLCDYSLLSSNEKKQAYLAQKRENLKICITGKYIALCDKELLTKEQLVDVKIAEKSVNLETCMNGNYKSLCNYSLLSKHELIEVKTAERQTNLKTCLNGNYSSLCDHSLLTASEALKVIKAEEKATELTSDSTNVLTSKTTKKSGGKASFYIEHSYDDVFFIINDEKFEAKTFCNFWNEGDKVIFIDGNAFGACATAKIYNQNRKEVCEVWCN